MRSDNILLSILIPTVPRRVKTCFSDLVTDLMIQARNRPEVEILGLYDNRRKTLSQKRNDLMGICRGKYFVFIDDDDTVHEEYVHKICNALEQHPETDVLVYYLLYQSYTGPDYLCYYDLSYDRHFEGNPPTACFSPPAHTHVWRKSLVADIPFPEIPYGEDCAWTAVAKHRVKNQTNIDEILYWYRDFTTEAGRRDR